MSLDQFLPLLASVTLFEMMAAIGLGVTFAVAPEEHIMMTLRKQVAALFVDRSSQQWVVQDPDGNFWTVPSVENAWNHRRPFQPSDKTELSPVPGHYKSTLGLPF